jgi:Uma2 family endonuclease
MQSAQRKSRMGASGSSRTNELFGQESNGILMTPEEFDRAEFERGFRYELVNGVLIVTPLPLLNEADPNEELGFLLRLYHEQHPQGAALNATFCERVVRTGKNRRRADRVIWAGLGRLPRRGDVPSVTVEFVGSRKRDRERDYETKRDEYMRIKVKEYWVIDRFRHTMTVFTQLNGKHRKRVLKKDDLYKTDLLPGFTLPLARLFGLADRWGEDQPE